MSEQHEEKKERGVWVTRAHMRLTGSPDCALFLAQCVYWSKCETVVQRSGWFYKTRDEWQEETCLSRYKQEKARKRLKALGVLQERHQRRNDGIRLWYRINLGLLNRLLNRMHPELGDCPVSMNVRSEKTGINEEILLLSEQDVSLTDSKAVDDIERADNSSLYSGEIGTNVPENNTEDGTENPCFSLNPEDYVFCHVFIYQFVNTQLHGTALRTCWQLYGLAHETVFNRFCDFVERHGRTMVDWYRQHADLEVPALTGDDIAFCNLAGRGRYAAT